MQFRSLSKSEIDISKYKKGKRIGEGGFGTVYKVELKETGEKYVAKVINCGDNEEKCNKMIDREVKIMMSINHPTFVNIIGYSKRDFLDESNITIIMDFIVNGSLSDILKNIQKNCGPLEYNNTSRQIIITGVSRALKYLHDRNIIHRDVKPGNVLLDEEFHPHITDFGLSKFSNIGHSFSQSFYGGTLCYMAPEIIKNEAYNNKVDVYSFGILMFEVITDLKPYPKVENGEITDYDFRIKVVNENYRPEFQFPIKKSLKKLIQKCWSADPKERPTFDEIFEMLSSCNDEYLLDDVDIEEFKVYIEDITEAKDPIEKVLDKNSSLEKENQKLKEEINKIKSSSAEIKEENQKLKEEINKIKSSCAEIKEENQKLKIDNKKILKENQKLKNEINKISIEKDKIQNENVKLKSKIEKLNDQLQSINSKNAKKGSSSTQSNIKHTQKLDKRSYDDTNKESSEYVYDDDYDDDVSQSTITNRKSDEELKNQEIWLQTEKIVKHGFYYDCYKSFNVIKAKVEDSIKKAYTIHKDVDFSDKLADKFTNKKSLGQKDKKEIYSKIEVSFDSTFGAAKNLKYENIKEVCVLNFGSATKPGGYVKDGSNGQEETLSRQSTLYFSISKLNEMYDYHKAHPSPFYTHYMIYSPNVVVIRDDTNKLIPPYTISIITAVAANCSKVSKHYPKGSKDKDIFICMKNRCRKILELAIVNNNKAILLGAFGCDYNGNKPEDISKIFKELLVDEFYGKFFTKVVFAIEGKPSKFNANYNAFKAAFKPPS